MGRAAQKLHSRRGASILMALAFFLLCGFIGAVVLGSAATNAQKLAGRRQEQQDYFAVSSAARLLQSALGGSACTAVETDTWRTCGESGHLAHFYTVSTDGEFLGDPENLLKRAALRVFRAAPHYPENKSGSVAAGCTADFTVRLDDLEGMPVVAGTLTMEEDYAATVVLRPQANDPDDPAATITLRFTGTKTQEQTGRGVTEDSVSCTHSYENAEGELETRFFPGKRDIWTTTVTWDAGTIIKGAPKDA